MSVTFLFVVAFFIYSVIIYISDYFYVLLKCFVMQNFARKFRLFRRMYPMLIIVIVMVLCLPFIVCFDAFKDIFIQKFSSEISFFALGLWEICFILVEPIITPRWHEIGWQFQKIFWTIALLAFYVIALCFGCYTHSIAFFVPLMVYFLRIFLPYRLVRKWTLIFYSVEDKNFD